MVGTSICFTIVILAMLLIFIIGCVGVYNMSVAYQTEIDALKETIEDRDETIDKLTKMNCDQILDNIVKDSE